MEPVNPAAPRPAPAQKRAVVSERAATKSEFGLALASFVAGAVLALSVIPAATFGEWTGFAVSIPFGLAAFTLGCVGKRSALGVAGIALSAIALIEGVGFLGWRSWRTKQHTEAEIASVEYERLSERTAAEYARAEALKNDTARANAEALRLQSENENALARIENTKARNSSELAQARERFVHTLHALAQTRLTLQSQNPNAVADIPTSDEIEQIKDIAELMRRESERSMSLASAERELRTKAGQKSAPPKDIDKTKEIKQKNLELWRLKLANAEKDKQVALRGKPTYSKQTLQAQGGTVVSQDNSDDVARWEAHIQRIESEITACEQMIKSLTKASP